MKIEEIEDLVKAKASDEKSIKMKPAKKTMVKVKSERYISDRLFHTNSESQNNHNRRLTQMKIHSTNKE